MVASPRATAAAGPTVFRLPLTPRLLSLFGVGMIGAVSVLMFGFLVAVLLIDQWIVAVVIAACTAVMVALTHYVLRDLRGKWGLRVVLAADSMDLSLPKNRSLIHPTPARHLAVPYADIAAIETRLEAYPSFGMVSMQQPYVLRLKNGEHVFLFEERAIGSGMQSAYFTGLIGDIAARAKVPVNDLGMTEGSGGILGVARTHAADWAAPPLPLSRQRRLARKAANTGALIFLLINLAFVVKAAIGFLR